MHEFLSAGETPKRSKSMSLHPTCDIDTKLIKQIGNYTLGAEVGSGAFGKVVLGKHYLTGETVAIKILDKMILSQTPEDYELVRQEISILKIVKHKYIVQLYEILQTPQHIFIVMEYCEGKDLMDYILTKTRLSELESLKFFQQLINALFYLHSQNISHRDVKIDNMLLDRNKDLKLVDFGLSTKYTDDSLLDQPCGTVVYAAPEVLDGNDYHGMLADVWSSGIVLFGMASGYLPFCDQDDEVNKKHVLEGKIDLPEFFSPMLKDLLRHMLDINPITRYTLQDIREHPWFNMNDINLIPGIIIGYNLIPVDENILNLCVAYNCDREKIESSVKNNKYDAGSALYYLLVRKITRKGFESVSDLSSEIFIDFILDDNNLVNKNREYKKIKNKEETNKNKLKNMSQINRNNSTASHRTNINNYTLEYNKVELTPSISNNKDIISTSNRFIDDLGAAPRLYPQPKNNHLKKQKAKKDNLFEKNLRKNKITSPTKNNQYQSKNIDELNKKNLLKRTKNNKLQAKNAHIKNSNYSNKKRLNNSTEYRHTYFKNINNMEINDNKNNKMKIKKRDNKNNNLNNNLNNIFNKVKEKPKKKEKEKQKEMERQKEKEKQNEFEKLKKFEKQKELEKENENENLWLKESKEINYNINKEYTINIEKIDEESNINLGKEETTTIGIKGTDGDINEFHYKENTTYSAYFVTNSQEFNSQTEKINKEIKKNKSKNNNVNKTPMKNNKKSITKYIKESAFSAYQDMSNKFKKKYEYNKLKNKSIQNKKLEKQKNKRLINDNINNSNVTILNKDKNEGYLGHSCVDINYSEYLKTPISSKTKNNNSSINKNLRSSYKNIINKNKKKIIEEKINKKKGINTNNTSSEKFNPKYYINRTIYNKNKTHKNNNKTSKYPNNTIYEFNYKSKNKNRIRLDFNPNKLYELNARDIKGQKKKNKLNNSVSLGKSEKKKITRLARYMNNYNRQYTKPAHLESSVINHRKIHSNTIRELSYSPNQKYLNEKNRKGRIPWKIQKKGIDEKMASESIYNKYMTRINRHNPLKPYGNKRFRMNLYNSKIKRNNNFIKNKYIHNSTLKSIKVDNKILNQTITIENSDSKKHLKNRYNKSILNKTNIQYKDKDKIKKKYSKEKRVNKHKAKCLSNESFPLQSYRLKKNNANSNSSYLNNYGDNFITINNRELINNPNYSIINCTTGSDVSSKKELFLNLINNKTSIFDLSCFVLDAKSFMECYQNLIHKFKKNGFNIFCSKPNRIKFTKANIKFNIEILKFNLYNEEKNENKGQNKDIFYYKINNKKGGIGINQIISKLLLSS